MKITWKIAKAELQTLFFSPLAWLVLVVFGIMAFGAFYDKFDALVCKQELGEDIGHVTRELYIEHKGFFSYMLSILYFFFPLLTMGLISRELGNGSIKLLDSSPISMSQVVIGKFISMCIFSLLLIFVLFLTVITGMFTVENLEMRAIFTALLGIYLLMCTYSAIGLCMSSLSSYPVVAAVGTFGVLAFLNVIGNVWQEYDFVRDITYWLSIRTRIFGFLRGIVESEDVIYYLLIIVLCLSLTELKLRFAKLVLPVWKKSLAYAGLVVVVLGVGYISALPAMKCYADGTEDKRNTLSVGSQEIMSKVEGKVKITTFVNILHKNSYSMLLQSVNSDKVFFEQYMRFHPDMDQEYVYYYGKPKFPSQPMIYWGDRAKLPEDSLITKICEMYRFPREKVVNQEEAQKLSPIDLAREGNPVIRFIEIDGKGARPLRMFEDMKVIPSEQEISASFMGVTEDALRAVFLTRNGLPDVDSGDQEGYEDVFNSPYIRVSLVNQGLDIQTIDVREGKLPENTDVLVIANPLEAYGDSELKMVHDYIAGGGNLFVLGDAGNEKIMNEIMAPLGVSFAGGMLMSPHGEESRIRPDIVFCKTARSAASVHPDFSGWVQDESKMLALKTATAIHMDWANHLDIEYLPMFASSSTSWLKRDALNLNDEMLKPDEAKGETPQPHVTMAALRRMVGEREQRVIVAADAEWLSNKGLLASYPGVGSDPAGLTSLSMSWLVNGKIPVNTKRGDVFDKAVDYKDVDLIWVYYLYVWLLPALMVFLGYMLYYRRNKQ